MELIEYDHVYQFVNASRQLTVDRRCNSWYIVNTGTTIITVNGVQLHPGVAGVSNGEVFVSGGNRGEIFRGRIDVVLPNNIGQATFVQKIYVGGVMV